MMINCQSSFLITSLENKALCGGQKGWLALLILMPHLMLDIERAPPKQNLISAELKHIARITFSLQPKVEERKKKIVNFQEVGPF